MSNVQSQDFARELQLVQIDQNGNRLNGPTPIVQVEEKGSVVEARIETKEGPGPLFFHLQFNPIEMTPVSVEFDTGDGTSDHQVQAGDLLTFSSLAAFDYIPVALIGKGDVQSEIPASSITVTFSRDLTTRRPTVLIHKGSTVTNLSAYSAEGGAGLAWYDETDGDLNLDGRVNLPDLLPLAENFGREGSSPLLKFLDWNGSGYVDASDLTPIAFNYGYSLKGFEVRRTDEGTTTSAPVGFVEGSNGRVITQEIEEGRAYLVYKFQDREAPIAAHYVVLPVSEEGLEGEASLPVRFHKEGLLIERDTSDKNIQKVIYDNLERNVIRDLLVVKFRSGTSEDRALELLYSYLPVAGIGRLLMPDFYEVRLRTDAKTEYAFLSSLSIPEIEAVDYVFIIPLWENEIIGPIEISALEKSPSLVVNDQLRSDQYNLNQMFANAAWDLSTGTNINIAIIDTGCRVTHDDLDDNISLTYNAINGGSNVTDQVGHGTGVAGVAAAEGNNAIGIAGVAFSAKLMPIKAGNGAFDSNVLANGLTWARNNGANVINMSLGGPGKLGSTFESALQAAFNAGICIIAATGNENFNARNDYPVSYPQVLAAAAVDRSGRRAVYSNYLDKGKLGAAITGEVATTWGGSDVQYVWFGGTSGAAPSVSGAAALVMAKNPALTPQQVYQIINDSATPIITDRYVGGMLNARDAVLAAGP